VDVPLSYQILSAPSLRIMPSVITVFSASLLPQYPEFISYHPVPPPPLYRSRPFDASRTNPPLPEQHHNIIGVATVATYQFLPNSIALSSLAHLYIVYVPWFRPIVLGVFWRTRSRGVRTLSAVAHAGGYRMSVVKGDDRNALY
jgi:hypothetical protein